MKRTPLAFTLPELLVVVAILGLLAALVLSAVSRAKVQTESVHCRNNLSQIGKAMASYAGDFGKYPGTRSAPIILKPNTPTHWDEMWDQRLLPFVGGNQAVFLCPSGQPRHVESYFSLTNYGYGYNAYGTGILLPDLNLGLGRVQAPDSDPSLPIEQIADSQVRAPSDMLAVGDLTDVQNVFVTTIEPVFFRPPYPGTLAARHNGGANMVFCDGHTEFARQTNWVTATAASRRRWNNDHEPHPETW